MATSPSVLSPPQTQYALDFLSLAGLDSHTPNLGDIESPSASIGFEQQSQHQSASSSSASHHAAVAAAAAAAAAADAEYDVPLDDPSPISLDSRPVSNPGRSRSAASRSNNGAGSSKKSSSARGNLSAASPMDVDNSTTSNGGGGSGHASGHLGGVNSGHSTPGIEANDILNANPMEMSPAVYDAIQAGILQHQVGSTHTTFHTHPQCTRSC